MLLIFIKNPTAYMKIHYFLVIYFSYHNIMKVHLYTDIMCENYKNIASVPKVSRVQVNNVKL